MVRVAVPCDTLTCAAKALLITRDELARVYAALLLAEFICATRLTGLWEASILDTHKADRALTARARLDTLTPNTLAARGRAGRALISLTIAIIVSAVTGLCLGGASRTLRPTTLLTARHALTTRVIADAHE